MRYRWKINHRQFRAGDPVPDTYDSGLIGTLLERHRIEAVDAPEAKAVFAPPADKAMKPAFVRNKRKAVGA